GVPDMPEYQYSQSPLVKKLAIKPKMRITAVSAIDGFRALLGDLPEGTSYADSLDGAFDWIIAFAKNEPELDGMMATLKAHLKPTGILWVAIPRAKNPAFNRSTLFASQERYGMELNSNAVVNDEWTAYRYKKV
ncbi:MAG: hypothetical protein K8I30_07885, partial [Anaerolineae bacterium]|nr:hypothetical protein [Anaerolineae bacterium]